MGTFCPSCGLVDHALLQKLFDSYESEADQTLHESLSLETPGNLAYVKNPLKIEVR